MSISNDWESQVRERGGFFKKPSAQACPKPLANPLTVFSTAAPSPARTTDSIPATMTEAVDMGAILHLIRADTKLVVAPL